MALNNDYHAMSFDSFWNMIKKNKNNYTFLADALYWINMPSHKTSHNQLYKDSSLIHLPYKAYFRLRDGMRAWVSNILGSYSKAQAYVEWKISIDDGTYSLEDRFQSELQDIRRGNTLESFACIRKFISEQSLAYKMALAKACVVFQAAHPYSFSTEMYIALRNLHSGGNI